VSGLFGDACGAVHSGGKSALFELPGKDQHVGVSNYLAVIKALELSAQAGEPFDICTSYLIIAGHLKRNRCNSDNLRPLFERAEALVARTGSIVRFVPGAENPACADVIQAWRRVGQEPRRMPSQPRTRPHSPRLDARTRQALIDAGWTPPTREAALVG
jgi:hypothetical protein